MRIFVADREGMIHFPPDTIGREIFFVADSAVVVDERDESNEIHEACDYE